MAKPLYAMILMELNKYQKALTILVMGSTIQPRELSASMMESSRETWNRVKSNGLLRNADIILDNSKMMNILMALRIRLLRK